MSILSSARNARNIKLAEKIFHPMKLNFPNDENGLTAARILLANTYALSGDKFMASNIRMHLKQSNSKRVIGYS